MMMSVPFYAQKWDLTQWKQLGFASFADAEYWERSSCGVLCLKMAIDGLQKERGQQSSPPLIEYIKTGVAIGAYHDATGWSHTGLVHLAKHFGFVARQCERVSVAELHAAIQQNHLVIVSVRSGFEKKLSLKEKLQFWKRFGGHLALVIGSKEENGVVTGLYVHHTSIFPLYNWEAKFVPRPMFEANFTGRCILIETSSKT
jgi:hypothetical protein